MTATAFKCPGGGRPGQRCVCTTRSRRGLSNRCRWRAETPNFPFGQPPQPWNCSPPTEWHGRSPVSAVTGYLSMTGIFPSSTKKPRPLQAQELTILGRSDRNVEPHEAGEFQGLARSRFDFWKGDRFLRHQQRRQEQPPSVPSVAQADQERHRPWHRARFRGAVGHGEPGDLHRRGSRS